MKGWLPPLTPLSCADWGWLKKGVLQEEFIFISVITQCLLSSDRQPQESCQSNPRSLHFNCPAACTSAFCNLNILLRKVGISFPQQCQASDPMNNCLCHLLVCQQKPRWPPNSLSDYQEWLLTEWTLDFQPFKECDFGSSLVSSWPTFLIWGRG